MADYAIMVGSPRANGTSAKLARKVAVMLEAAHPDAHVHLISAANLGVAGCNGCEYCRNHDGCVIGDDMGEVLSILERADVLLVISPVYFAGAPSQFKAILDRFQPLYWRRKEARASGEELPAKRPAYVCIVGDGGDPHGYDPLVTTLRSALALAGFQIANVQAFIDAQSKRISADELSFCKAYV